MSKQSDKAKRMEAFEKVRDALRPYMGRIVAEWHDKQENAMYVWLLCSKEADAGDDRHRWRGTVTVNIQRDGSTFFAMSEELVIQAFKRHYEMGSNPVFTLKAGTWEATKLLLEILIPALPAEQALAA